MPSSCITTQQFMVNYNNDNFLLITNNYVYRTNIWFCYCSLEERNAIRQRIKHGSEIEGFTQICTQQSSTVTSRKGKEKIEC